jgi:hypothetical protein
MTAFLATPPTDCAAMLALFPEGPKDCSDVWGCQGELLVAGCSSVNCAALGSHCVGQGKQAMCSDGSATLVADTCTANGSAVTTVNGLLVAENCPALGQTCRLGPDFTHVCSIPWSPPVLPTSYSEAAAAVTCIANCTATDCGASCTKTDCALTGRTCYAVTGGVQCGVAADPVLLWKGALQCSGTYLFFSGMQGELRYFNCADLGGTCVALPGTTPDCQ